MIHPKLPNYRLIALVGKGSSGLVYKAFYKPERRVVAVKVLKLEASRNQQARFVREVKAISQLRHPNIIEIFDVGLRGEVLYYSMPYIEGNTLRRHLRKAEPPLEAVVAVLAKVARALDYAHEKGFVHRDVKPQNILIAKDGEPFLIDFGFAKKSEGDFLVTRIGATVGSPMYMAPEQASGRLRLLGPKTDVYALGTILYLVLTGTLPHPADQPAMAIVRSILTVVPQAPRSINPSAPAPLEAVCMRAMEKTLEDRYSSAAAFADDLESWLEGSQLSDLVALGPPPSWSSTSLKAVTSSELRWWPRLWARLRRWLRGAS